MRRLLTFLLIEFITQACSSYEDLNILTLLPLSGFEEVKGLAQYEAIRIATEDVLTARGLSNDTEPGFNYIF